MKPEQPAPTSKAAARRALSLSCTRHAVAGNGTAGVMVATMRMSTSIASTPAAARAFTAAPSPRVAESSPGPQTRRSPIPVRLWIHVSVVSTIRSRSWFVSTLAGAHDPVPMTRLVSIRQSASRRPAPDVASLIPRRRPASASH